MSRKEKALEFANELYNISVVGRNVDITDSIKNYAMEKISKIERFTQRMIDVHVILDIQKLAHRVEIIVKTGRVKFSAIVSSHDLYLSIDEAVRKIEAQIRKYKGKLQDFHARDVISREINVDVLSNPPTDDEPYEYEANPIDGVDLFNLPKIIKRKTLSLSTLTQHEAIMKMQLSGDSFLVFKNEEDQRLKILYRRKDSTLGLIDLPV